MGMSISRIHVWLCYTYPDLLVKDFVNFSLEIYVQLFFFLFLFRSYYYYLRLESFSYQRQLIVFPWSLNNNKYQVSGTLLSILDVLSNVIVWIVSAHPLISKSSSPFINPSVTVPIGINVTFMFQRFFNSLGKTRYLSFFSFSFNFTLLSAGTAKSTILQVLFFVVYHMVWSSGRD